MKNVRKSSFLIFGLCYNKLENKFMEVFVMLNLEKIEKTMIKEKISSEIIEKMKFTYSVNNDTQNVIAVIHKMDELLSNEQRLAIMEKQDCCKGGQRDRDCKAFGKEHKDKPLAEKLALLSGVQYMMSPRLNSDSTITVL